LALPLSASTTKEGSITGPRERLPYREGKKGGKKPDIALVGASTQKKRKKLIVHHHNNEKKAE